MSSRAPFHQLTADGVDRRRRPDPEIAARERQRALAGELRHELADERTVLGVEVLGAEGVGEGEDLLDVVAERIGDAQRVVGTCHRAPASEPVASPGCLGRLTGASITKTGDPGLEETYARQFVWPGKGPFHPPAPKETCE